MENSSISVLYAISDNDIILQAIIIDKKHPFWVVAFIFM